MREEVGGGVFNAVRSAARRGLAASLLSVRGGDSAGDSVARAIAEYGIEDLSAVFLDRATPSYTALIDRDGELIAGFADMELYELAFPKQMRRAKVREAIGATDALLCDANLPAEALERLAGAVQGKPVFAIAISPAKVVRFRPVMDRLALMFMNRRESIALSGLDQHADDKTVVAGLRELELKAGVITSGSGPLLLYDETGTYAIPPPSPRSVADVTGAGDALAGATVAALMQGQSLRSAVREGMAAALLAVESPFAVPAFTKEAFEDALALVPEAQAVSWE